MKSDNLTNQESRAYAITAYEIYKKNPEYAKELMFNSEDNYNEDNLISNSLIFNNKSFYHNKIFWRPKNTKYTSKLSFNDYSEIDINLNLPKLSEVEDKEITDQSIKDYADLIERVSKIDVDAAAYMLFEAYKLERFNFVGNLTLCFDWGDTPQGSVYWYFIWFNL